MECSGEDHIERFVIELLSTGSLILGAIRDLTDALPPDAYPGEAPAEVVVEMVCGSIASALGAVEPARLRSNLWLAGHRRFRIELTEGSRYGGVGR